MKNLQVNQIVENVLQDKKRTVIVCRVVELVRMAGEPMVRLCDARETRDNIWLVANNRTWAAPLENIRPHDADCLVCHKDGLVSFGGAV